MNHVILPLIISASTVLAAYGLSEHDKDAGPSSGARLPPDAIAPDPEHLEAYLGCSEEAERRLLSHTEATVCLDRYLLLKLSFLPGIGIEKFMRLVPAERWVVNQRGYAAYTAWKAGASPGTPETDIAE